MYKFPAKLKIGAIVLMIIGFVMTVLSFMSAPKTLDEAKAIIAEQQRAHGGHHGGDSHNSSTSEHKNANAHSIKEQHSADAEHKTDKEEKAHVEPTKHESVASSDSIDQAKKDSTIEHKVEHKTEQHVTNAKSSSSTDVVSHEVKEDQNQKNHETTGVTHHSDNNKTDHKESHTSVDSHAHGDHHAEHVFHQLQNRPVSAFYVAMLFFLGISLLVMAFYAAQRIAQAGWSVVLFRVFEAITNNLHYVSIIMLLFIIGTAMHYFHLFPWMKEGTLTPGSENFDPIVYGKKWFLNVPGWTIRSIVYLLIWNVLRLIIRRMSIKQDNGDLKLHKRLFNLSVAFIATFLVTESMMSWDWIMGIDPHWFSTLFGWYVLATFLVCALTVVAMVTIYLRSQGALPLVNDSHIHDLAKFMFGFSVFWTYLWFAQFMLVWYADMPEETTYFVQRFNDYKLPFLGMIALNFIFPVLVLLNSDFKSMPWFVIIAGLIILAGHYVDLYVMIMPGTVGDQFGFGIGELGGLLFFIGLFIFATFSAFAKVSPVPKGNPFLHESETFHYYNIKHRGEDNSHH